MEQNEPLGTKEYEDLLDQNIVVLMYDGDFLYGILRSFDQFNNITLENCVQRIFHKKQYFQKSLGLYMIRGENIVLLGLSNLNLRDFEKVDQKTIETTLQ
ncbi:Small Nuclear ribonucleoprotein splicing factor [Pseudoloma neurophilia]|uniref:U6 snRNA-associated Sm-like protein LSm1 n=1 Tax=Pseudoloma neurophilia TaxID=146866 RepID=A0A0R0LVL3_9MICR|nr:Small Nuclear ribonucleoprotein splicing factor [Pseudoloma neurophilia]